MMPLFDIVTHRDVTVNAQHSCDFNFRKLKADKISRGKHNVMRMAAIFANNSDEYQSMTRQCHMVSTYYVVVANLNFDHLNQLSTYCIGRKKRLAPTSLDFEVKVVVPICTRYQRHLAASKIDGDGGGGPPSTGAAQQVTGGALLAR